MTAERVNPFDLSDFAPEPAKEKKSKPVEKAAIDQVAKDNGFPSRQPAKAETEPTPMHPPQVPLSGTSAAVPEPRQQRRYTTGRNQQINIKAKAETIKRFHDLADAHGVPLGEILERALNALEGGTK
jgi:hypothetical protein